ncbi:MAG: hypothetical protein CBB68_00950 [Rhodospirillaceae bacterium TMED8]|nr:cytochrome c family protein [Magnetovibrio sp.]OUT53249.1 MAG: hypothetical protein CBB68_00950 [Rhodospirillaceae bacterium TMED8]|tara:strand:+ start:1425 stop:1961 length:537 start_codon:yes stop_codon:yes gene_type:complete
MHFDWVHKIGLAVLIAMWVTFGSHMAGELLVEANEPTIAAYAVEAEVEAPNKDIAQVSEDMENSLVMMASADMAKGEKIFAKCKACHSVNKGGKNKVGPNLWEIVGKTTASNSGFQYSNALKEKGGEWTYQNLDAFLTKPKAYAPGTKMSFAGLKKPAQRASMLLYLRSLSDAPKPLP